MSAVLEQLQSTLDGLLRRAEPLAKHTTMRVGGPAQWWAEPNSEEELIAVLSNVANAGVPLKVLGAGSNLVPNDHGFEGVVLHLGKGFEWQRAEATYLHAGGAALLPKLTKFALQYGLGNFEWACGIPGSLGGSIWGNAGSRGFNGHEWESRDAAADLHSLVAFDRQGQRHELQRSDIQFAYRRSSLDALIVTQATFALKPLDETQAAQHREAVAELLRLRRETQPVSSPSAGCIWKNPGREACAEQGCSGTGQLVEKLGLKGRRVGGAQVSEVHGNFIINAGGASGADVRQLMINVEDEVRAQTGIVLEREVRLLD
jgi:UDP-N-acetylmuramate dehydrogenase